MAEHTDQNLLHQVIYSVFVRNHTKEGPFRALEGDLDRLKGLGADIIWLIPLVRRAVRALWAAPTPFRTTAASIPSTARGRTSSIWWMPSMLAA